MPLIGTSLCRRSSLPPLRTARLPTRSGHSLDGCLSTASQKRWRSCLSWITLVLFRGARAVVGVLFLLSRVRKRQPVQECSLLPILYLGATTTCVVYLCSPKRACLPVLRYTVWRLTLRWSFRCRSSCVRSAISLWHNTLRWTGHENSKVRSGGTAVPPYIWVGRPSREVGRRCWVVIGGGRGKLAPCPFRFVARYFPHMFGLRKKPDLPSEPRVSTKFCTHKFNGKYPHVGLYDCRERTVWVCKPLS